MEREEKSSGLDEALRYAESEVGPRVFKKLHNSVREQIRSGAEEMVSRVGGQAEGMEALVAAEVTAEVSSEIAAEATAEANAATAAEVAGLASLGRRG